MGQKFWGWTSDRPTRSPHTLSRGRRSIAIRCPRAEGVQVEDVRRAERRAAPATDRTPVDIFTCLQVRQLAAQHAMAVSRRLLLRDPVTPPPTARAPL
jgi:hypothetical protein